jgi:hypothetical protein
MENKTPLFNVADQLLVNFFDKNDVDNYISHVIEDNEKGAEYLITMQRINGETPLHQLAREKERVIKLEANQVPVENGTNRYGLDKSYFRKTINRELNGSLSDFRPDELARVFARLAKAADRSVLLEAEFTSDQPLNIASEKLTKRVDPVSDQQADSLIDKVSELDSFTCNCEENRAQKNRIQELESGMQDFVKKIDVLLLGGL